MKNSLLLLIAAAFGYALAKSAKPKPLTVEVVGTLKANGADLAAVLRTRDYRAMRTEGFLRPPAKSLEEVLLPANRTFEPGRATGQTTRLVDAAIQTLFAKGEVVVRDHVDRRANHKLVYELVEARLKLEHRRERFVFDDSRLTILLPTFCKA